MTNQISWSTTNYQQSFGNVTSENSAPPNVGVIWYVVCSHHVVSMYSMQCNITQY